MFYGWILNLIIIYDYIFQKSKIILSKYQKNKDIYLVKKKSRDFLINRFNSNIKRLLNPSLFKSLSCFAKHL